MLTAALRDPCRTHPHDLRTVETATGRLADGDAPTLFREQTIGVHDGDRGLRTNEGHKRLTKSSVNHVIIVSNGGRLVKLFFEEL